MKLFCEPRFRDCRLVPRLWSRAEELRKMADEILVSVSRLLTFLRRSTSIARSDARSDAAAILKSRVGHVIISKARSIPFMFVDRIDFQNSLDFYRTGYLFLRTLNL